MVMSLFAQFRDLPVRTEAVNCQALRQKTNDIKCAATDGARRSKHGDTAWPRQGIRSNFFVHNSPNDSGAACPDATRHAAGLLAASCDVIENCMRNRCLAAS